MPTGISKYYDLYSFSGAIAYLIALAWSIVEVFMMIFSLGIVSWDLFCLIDSIMGYYELDILAGIVTWFLVNYPFMDL